MTSAITRREWDHDPDDASLSSTATTSTTLTGLLANSLYYLKIWAVDNYGNETTVADINVTTDATTTNQLTDITDNVMHQGNTALNYGSNSVMGGASAGAIKNGGFTEPIRGLLKINK